jgi:hypothetical protein
MSSPISTLLTKISEHTTFCARNPYNVACIWRILSSNCKTKHILGVSEKTSIEVTKFYWKIKHFIFSVLNLQTRPHKIIHTLWERGTKLLSNYVWCMMVICSIFPNRAYFARKFILHPLLKNNERHDSKLTKFRYNEEGLQYLIWCENHLSYSYMGESGFDWLGASFTNTHKRVFEAVKNAFWGFFKVWELFYNVLRPYFSITARRLYTIFVLLCI